MYLSDQTTNFIAFYKFTVCKAPGILVSMAAMMHAQHQSVLKGDRFASGSSIRTIKPSVCPRKWKAIVVNSQNTDVEGVIDNVADGIVRGTQTAASAVKQGLEIVDRGVQIASDAYSKVSPVIEKATKSVSPIIEEAVEGYGKPLASSLASQVSKGASQAVSGVGSLVEQAGVSPSTVKEVQKTASTVATTAKPVVSSAIEFVTTTPPMTLLEYAAGATAFTLALPTLTSLLVKNLRGYAGVVSPAIALDKMSTTSQVALIDIRSVSEKEGSGIPDLRDKSKYIELEFAAVKDPNVRRELKNIGNLEISLTSMQIAALKKVSKSTEVYIMDKNGSLSGAVAKQLSSRGFSKVYTVRGGFSAWNREKLPIRMATSVSAVEVVAPGAVLFGSTKKTISDGSTTKKSLPNPVRKALPASTRNAA